MTLRSIVLSLFAVFALVACGPSAAQLQTARTARYQASASEVFQAGVAALKANNYKLKSADAVTARALAEERWYEVDGTTMSRDSEGRPQMTNAGGILFAVEVGVVADGDAFRVEVIPHVWRKRDGSSLPEPIKPGAVEMPGWVAGKLDNLHLSVYEALKAKAAAPTAAPTPGA
jgi:hypothetical protein